MDKPDLRYFAASIYDYDGLYASGTRYLAIAYFLILVSFPLLVFSLDSTIEPHDLGAIYNFIFSFDVFSDRYHNLLLFDPKSPDVYFFSLVAFIFYTSLLTFSTIAYYLSYQSKNEVHPKLHIKSIHGTLGSAAFGATIIYFNFMLPLEFHNVKYLGMRSIFISPIFPIFTSLVSMGISTIMFNVLMFIIKLTMYKGKFSYD